MTNPQHNKFTKTQPLTDEKHSLQKWKTPQLNQLDINLTALLGAVGGDGGAGVMSAS